MAIIKIVLTGTTDSETTDIIRGTIHAVRFDITATTPAAQADLTVVEAGSLGRTIASASNIAADAIRYPSVELDDGAGSGRTSYVPMYVNDKLTVSMAQGDSDNVINVYILWLPDEVSG